MNTDCVIFNKAKLPFESVAVTDNSSRTLTSILQSLLNNTRTLSTEFHTIGDGDFILSKDADIITLEDIEGTIGLTATITLPTNSLDYANKIFTFINTTPAASGNWLFNVPITVDFDPLTTSNNYNTIVPEGTKVLRLAFINTSPTSYGWRVL
jgi:hypothetical protein